MRNFIVALNGYSNKAGNYTNVFFNYEGGVASSRLQLRPALLAAKALGMESQVWSLHTSQPEDLYKMRNPKICIVGKLNSNTNKTIQSLAAANLAAVAHMKRKKVPVVLLYSDNHLNGAGLTKELYQDLVYFADTIVCPTKTLAKQIEILSPSPKSIHVIKDPWSLRKNTYHRTRNCELELAWFGSGLNMPYLAREIQEIINKISLKASIKITALSSPYALNRLESFLKKINYDKSKFIFSLIEWNHLDQPTQLENILAAADIAIIPSDPNDPRKAGVSHNRIVDAARMGCIPVASPMESYKELSKISLLGNNFPQMIEFAWANRERLRKKYGNIRDRLLEEFSPEKNLETWTTIITKILSENCY